MGALEGAQTDFVQLLSKAASMSLRVISGQAVVGQNPLLSAMIQIVLQKSFCAADQKFSGLQMRLSNKDVRLHRQVINLPVTSVTTLQPHQLAITACLVFWREKM